MKLNDFLGILIFSILLVGCGESDSSVNPEPEPPITEDNINANDPVKVNHL